jgi:dGTP triphosphohydrolase
MATAASGAHTGDYRTDGEHDADRILYSDAFRRLAGVTQVVAASEKPLFHNRLTHTLKVAQLSRRLAEHLNRAASQSGGEHRGPDRSRERGGVCPRQSPRRHRRGRRRSRRSGWPSA